MLESDGGSRLGERRTLVIGDVPAADIVIHRSAGATEIHYDDEQYQIVPEGNAVLRLKRHLSRALTPTAKGAHAG
ncbi:hypothetical protein H7J77_10205 [Mycolicibacillus parakoreensis]|uniref:Uncharacterized protein n=1 Tax=Mycolicibacillus parakoreensis TaxID=1069221 RepID=A0ABY3U3W2_9MYCO|nr:hypothetical protein [Mycolicibacillus parakoreensis]MCV7315912.1 hypothetical protein [Mycolicibacillus parakoreensis]ULN52456.1 hypothetical protein MIU77_16705 [Mycolicibacillus parakoreensis]